MSRLFISQERIDLWTTQQKVNIEGDQMVLPAFRTTFRLLPAVLFERVVDGEDTLALVGRVKSEEQLRQIGAEIVANSVILGEAAYECVNGFLGEVEEPGSIAGEGKQRGLRRTDLQQLTE